MKAKAYCIAFGCLNNNKDRDRNLTFFTLPKDIERRRKWLTLIDREDLLEREDLKKSSHLVCSEHFEDSSIKIIKHLQENALPSMLLHSPPQEGASYPETQSTSAPVKDKVTALSNIIVEGSCTSEVQSTSARIKGKGKSKVIKLSNNTESLRSTEKQTQTSKSLTEGTRRKRKLSNEIHELAAVKSDEIHKGFTCNVCSGSIVGFRYTCVQCAHYDICASCEARGEHSLHYMLRIPRPVPFAEVVCMLSTIRSHLIYGLDNEEAGRGAGADDRVVPALPPVETIKVEIKEEPSDPFEQETVLPDDNYTESDIMTESALTIEDHVPVDTSTTILTDTIGNYLIIENPVKVSQAKSKKTKHMNTTEAEHGSEKRMKISLEEDTQASATAGPSIEGASGEMLQNYETEEKDEGSFQVFSHTTMMKTPAQAQTAENTVMNMAPSTSKIKTERNVDNR